MQKSKPILVVVLSRFPYPLEKGDKLRAYYQLIHLSQHFDIHLLCLSDSDVSAEQVNKINPYVKSCSIFRLSKWKQIGSIFAAFFTGIPFQVAYFTQKSIKLQIDKILADVKPDFIYCQLLRPAEYVKNEHACPKTIDLMDALSKGMERRAKQAPFWSKWIFKEEAERLKKYERKLLDYFDKVSIISEQDRRYILHPKINQIKVIPNGVGEQFFNASDEKKTNDLLFTGNMSYDPNIKAAHFLAHELIPNLPNRTLSIVGANPDASVQKLQNSHIQVTGWVDDIVSFYKRSTLFVAPIFTGSGMQNKILEAMAAGIPCITTTLVNNAIKAEPDKEILIANTKEEFLEQIKRISSNPNLAQQVSNEAKKFVTLNYNWEQINQELINLIES